MLAKRTLAVITANLLFVVTFFIGGIKSDAAGAGATGDTYVYVTKTGDCYHSSGCSSLRKSCISISLQDAIDDGYKPCRRCFPVALDTVPLMSEVELEIEALRTYEGNTKDFNAYAYYMNNVDLQIEIGPDGDALLEHYIEQGKEDGRIAKESGKAEERVSKESGKVEERVSKEYGKLEDRIAK